VLPFSSPVTHSVLLLRKHCRVLFPLAHELRNELGRSVLVPAELVSVVNGVVVASASSAYPQNGTHCFVPDVGVAQHAHARIEFLAVEREHAAVEPQGVLARSRHRQSWVVFGVW
jgi:hypothetical protein